MEVKDATVKFKLKCAICDSPIRKFGIEYTNA